MVKARDECSEGWRERKANKPVSSRVHARCTAESTDATEGQRTCRHMMGACSPEVLRTDWMRAPLAPLSPLEATVSCCRFGSSSSARIRLTSASDSCPGRLLILSKSGRDAIEGGDESEETRRGCWKEGESWRRRVKQAKGTRGWYQCTFAAACSGSTKIFRRSFVLRFLIFATLCPSQAVSSFAAVSFARRTRVDSLTKRKCT